VIELIGIVACILACIGLPFQVSAIKSGKAFEKSPEKREMILAATRRQFNLLSWVGIALGIAMIGLSFVPDEPGEGTFKLVSGVLWLVLSAECFWAKSQIAGVPATV
jgi:hypothetical protein